MISKMNSRKLGFYTAILTSVLTAIAFGIAVFTPPISGPFCQGSCIDYPFTDIISRFPRDYIWMYPAIVLNLVVVVLMVCVHRSATEEKKVFSLAGLCFTLISSTILIVDYFIQITVIQPSLIKGETDGIVLLTQYNPHGIFIALENAAYLVLSFAFLLLAFVFTGTIAIEKALRWLFISGFVLATGLFITLTSVYGNNLEYRFEVAVLTIDWTVLIVAGILLARIFSLGIKEKLLKSSHLPES